MTKVLKKLFGDFGHKWDSGASYKLFVLWAAIACLHLVLGSVIGIGFTIFAAALSALISYFHYKDALRQGVFEEYVGEDGDGDDR